MKKMDVSSGLLERLLDPGIINRQHYQAVKVFCLLCRPGRVYLTLPCISFHLWAVPIYLINLLKIICDCCKQAEMKEDERVNRLLDILLRRDDKLLPMFCDILTSERQPHVVQILRRNGVNTSLLTSFTCGQGRAKDISLGLRPKAESVVGFWGGQQPPFPPVSEPQRSSGRSSDRPKVFDYFLHSG